MVQKFETQPIFENNFGNGESQIFVEQQLLATLICIESYGNTASLIKIGDLCEMGKSIVDKVCCQIITVIQSSNLQITYIG